jgi:hypothetical protein
MLPELAVLMPQASKELELDGLVLICQWDKFRNLLTGQHTLSMTLILELLLQLDLGVKILKLIHSVLRTIIQMHA